MNTSHDARCEVRQLKWLMRWVFLIGASSMLMTLSDAAEPSARCEEGPARVLLAVATLSAAQASMPLAPGRYMIRMYFYQVNRRDYLYANAAPVLF